MRRGLFPVLTMLVLVLAVGAAPAARADTATGCSEPTRAVCVTSDAGADWSKNRDGDYTTAAQQRGGPAPG